VTTWSKRTEWDNRRRKPVLHDRILTATCHWIKGNWQGALIDEELEITDACIDGDEMIITYLPYTPNGDGVPFRASFQLGALELETSARLRQSASAGT
jgi:hypothetical protein